MKVTYLFKRTLPRLHQPHLVKLHNYLGFKPRSISTSMSNQVQLEYPKARRDESVIDTLHGVNIADPYRWLEDPDSEETKQFVDQQVQITQSYLDRYKDELPNIRKKIETLYNFPKQTSPFKRGDYYYYFYNPGLAPQSVLYQLKSLDDEPKIFFDPNTLSEDGTVSLGTYAFSENGEYFAYGTSQSGSDWVSVRIKSVASGELLEETLDWLKFSGISWTKDSAGFFYSRFPAVGGKMDDNSGTSTGAHHGHQVYYHKLNTPQSQDQFIFEDKEHPDHLVNGSVSYDGRYLFLEITESCNPVNKLYVTKLHNGPPHEEVNLTNVEFTKLIDNFEAGYDYITNDDSVGYFLTNLSAPKYRVIKMDLEDSSKEVVEVIPEKAGLLESVSCIAGDKLVLVYLENVTNNVQLYNLLGEHLQSLDHDLGTIGNVSGRRSLNELFFKMVGFLNPGIIYRYDLSASPSGGVWRRTEFQDPALALHLDESLITKQIYFESSDGTKVPMFLVSKKNPTNTGPRPTLLYGYGGFSISITPAFSPQWLGFVENFDGVLAIANIRGGNEFGEDWHQQGILDKKQQGLDDFQYAAKYLIQQNITTAKQLIINGGSNGGLLVGASITQAPELFGGAIADVGVLDMLRFHKFTIGHAWRSDYGDPDNPDHFKFLIKYSPLHNVKPSSEVNYPPTLLATGDHDDRVSPLHTLKFLATLQYHQQGNPNPLLGRIETKAGHGAGKPTQKKIDEIVDKLAFIGLCLGGDGVKKPSL